MNHSSATHPSLGQFFTPPHIVSSMWKLKHNPGQTLEPASGNSAFLISPHAQNLPITAIEIDPSLNSSDKTSHNPPHKILIQDFFNYPLSEKFDTIIGNPPYVRFQDISPATKKNIHNFLISLAANTPASALSAALSSAPAPPPYSIPAFDSRTNLYLFFIYKAVLHLKDKGELIFITPRDFTKATSAKNLNEYLFQNGTITHFQDYGDTKIFQNATPNCAVWRFEKGKSSPRMADGRTFLCHQGQLTFSPAEQPHPPTHRIGDSFEVKVGAVSGADHIYKSTQDFEQNCEQDCKQNFVCSQTRATGNLRTMIYNKKSRALLPHKQELLQRRIRKFDENNWWQWGRKYPERTGTRIYVNGKTRIAKPFFVSEVEAFDGSVLALFPKKKTENLAEICEELNRQDWRALGFMTGGRYLFSQRSLENANIDLAL